MKQVLVTFGTRPEAIKMAPVVAALRRRPEDFAVRVCVTAQHRGLLDQVLELFGIRPEIDLDLMRPGQSPAEVTARVLESMTRVLVEAPADVVLVHGDTTTALATALAAFYREVPVGHVEAGLRSGRMDAPFPEEMNRVVIDRMAAHLYAPTPAAARHLAREGVREDAVLVTGNTAIDALLHVRERLDAATLPVREVVGEPARLVLVTAHRRESFGAPLAQVFQALNELAEAHPDVGFVYPVHPNPRVEGPARETLTASNIRLLPPVGYAELVWLLDRAELVLTDSGGIQEEAATLGRPLLVLREVTERPEIVDAGAGTLVGTDRERIVREATRLLADGGPSVGTLRDLFGDGHAGERIASDLAGDRPAPWAPAREARAP